MTAARRPRLPAQCLADALGQQRVKHHAMPGEHRLDRVPRQEAHDHVDGRADARGASLFVLARALADGPGHVADDMGEKRLKTGIRLSLHGGARSPDG